jgi:hypothetical protein
MVDVLLIKTIHFLMVLNNQQVQYSHPPSKAIYPCLFLMFLWVSLLVLLALPQLCSQTTDQFFLLLPLPSPKITFPARPQKFVLKLILSPPLDDEVPDPDVYCWACWDPENIFHRINFYSVMVNSLSRYASAPFLCTLFQGLHVIPYPCSTHGGCGSIGTILFMMRMFFSPASCGIHLLINHP